MSRRQPDLSKVRQYIEHHYHEAITVIQLAEMAGFNRKYFMELFKKLYGCSPLDYITGLRIERAKRYLVETNFRLREIAHRVGYSDEFYFSRKFKQKVGVSPSAFARQPARRIAACSPGRIGDLLALQLVPAAAPLDAKWTPFYYQLYRERIEVKLEYHQDGTIDWESLLRARPDIVVGAPKLPERPLRAELPLFIPENPAEDWRERLRKTAGYLDLECKAEAWIEDYDKKVQFARNTIAQSVGDDTFAVLRIYENNLFLYTNRGIAEVFYQDLQLSPADTRICGGSRAVTVEDLTALNPSRLLVAVCPEARSRSFWLALQHRTAWRNLRAVKSGALYLIPSDPWFEYSAHAVNRILDEALLLFTGQLSKPASGNHPWSSSSP